MPTSSTLETRSGVAPREGQPRPRSPEAGSREQLVARRIARRGQAHGRLSTSGRLTGPFTALRAAGKATVNDLAASSLTALTFAGDYDVTIPSGDATNGNATFKESHLHLVRFKSNVKSRA